MVVLFTIATPIDLLVAASAVNHFDVAIVGGGSVGSLLALLLAKIEQPTLKIALVEAGPYPAAINPSESLEQYKASNPVDALATRTIALNLSSIGLLDELGLWQALPLERRCAFKRMHIWDQHGAASLCFDSSALASKQQNYGDVLGYIVEAPLLNRLLAEKVTALKGCTVFAASKLQSLTLASASHQQHDLHLDNGSSLQCRYLFATDGAHSSVRSLAAIPWRSWDCKQDALICTIAHELAHDYVAHQRFLDTGPMALLPLPSYQQSATSEVHLSSLIWSLQRDKLAHYRDMSDKDFIAALNDFSEGVLGTVTACSQRMCFPLYQGLSTNMFSSGVVLVGDAAHLLHPMAGLGTNLGFKDCTTLVQAIQELGLSDTAFKTYVRRRLPHNSLMLAIMYALSKIYSQRLPLLSWLRNTGMQQLDRLPLFKRLIMALVQ